MIAVSDCPPKNMVALELAAEFAALKQVAMQSASNVEIYQAVQDLEKKVMYYIGQMELKELVIRPDTRWG